jgi:hypothetical protein
MPPVNGASAPVPVRCAQSEATTRGAVGALIAGHHLAQLNIARAIAPLDGPELTEFMALLEPINAVADRSPGFVWRLQSDDGDATAIRALDDDRAIVNMSVWESIEHLWRFVYDSEHLDVMRRRRDWFSRSTRSVHMVLWWIAAGRVPSIDEAKRRLAHLEAHGPTPHAFTFKHHFASPDTHAVRLVDERPGCPT